jgi:hypothetical protein
VPEHRYTAELVDNHSWGGAQWWIWDHEHETWADDLGHWLTEEAAQDAADAANASEAP